MSPAAAKYAVVVIDMLNDYLSPGGKLVCEPCRAIILGLKDFLTAAREREWLIAYVGTSLDNDAEPLAKKWGLHARIGTLGAEVIDELAPHSKDAVIRKKGYDAFHATPLEPILASHGITHVILTGIHTHVCILSTAFGAFNRGFEVIVLEDCVATEKPHNHESRLPFFESHLGRVLTSRQLLAEVPARSR